MTDTRLHQQTPLLRSAALSTPDQNVWLKMEALQPAGSFKNRGIGYACQQYVSNGATRLLSSSGGNAGIATAYCGMRLGVPVEVVVPESAPAMSIAAIRRFGASVTVHGASWIEAHERVLSMQGDDSALIHPFDDPLLWPGHGTMIDEVVAQGVNPDVVVLSVGGGGLLCGVAAGLDQHGLSAVEIIAVETQGAASLARAIEQGQLVMLDEVTTIANTLGAKQVSAAALEVTQSHSVTSCLVTDKQALDACERFLDEQRVLVEPACGASLAAVYDKEVSLTGKRDVLIIVCGGMGVSLAQLSLWRALPGMR